MFAMAERPTVATVATLDRRDFTVVHPRHVKALRDDAAVWPTTHSVAVAKGRRQHAIVSQPQGQRAGAEDGKPCRSRPGPITTTIAEAKRSSSLRVMPGAEMTREW
jgi:hypothetical protein